MKKSSLMALCFCTCLGFYTSVQAAQPPVIECQYTVLQNLIRDARNHDKIFEFIRAGVPMDDNGITCGGTLMQLAIRRGNTSILNGILTQDQNRINLVSPVYDLAIPNAPDRIPIILFGAYYAPSEAIFKVLLDNNADVSVRDSYGHTILWYLNQNPVLRQTATEDKVKQMMQQKLFNSVKPTEETTPAAEPKIDLNADTMAQP